MNDGREDVLARFHPAVANWFRAAFESPTPPQTQAWPEIQTGRPVLIAAPTGSGKTLTAFLASIDRLTSTPRPEDRALRTRVLYISPLRALAFDIEKNLRAPLVGIGLAAERLGVEPPLCVVIEDAPAGLQAAKAAAMRTIGVTTTHERQALGDADLVVGSLAEDAVRTFLSR